MKQQNPNKNWSTSGKKEAFNISWQNRKIGCFAAGTETIKKLFMFAGFFSIFH
jgi:hypothetical protein